MTPRPALLAPPGRAGRPVVAASNACAPRLLSELIRQLHKRTDRIGVFFAATRAGDWMDGSSINEHDSWPADGGLARHGCELILDAIPEGRK